MEEGIPGHPQPGSPQNANRLVQSPGSKMLLLASLSHSSLEEASSPLRSGLLMLVPPVSRLHEA